jgi:hypothetical protein
MEMEKESEKGVDSRRNNIEDDNNNQEATAEVLEKGDIFSFSLSFAFRNAFNLSASLGAF